MQYEPGLDRANWQNISIKQGAANSIDNYILNNVAYYHDFIGNGSKVFSDWYISQYLSRNPDNGPNLSDHIPSSSQPLDGNLGISGNLNPGCGWSHNLHFYSNQGGTKWFGDDIFSGVPLPNETNIIGERPSRSGAELNAIGGSYTWAASAPSHSNISIRWNFYNTPDYVLRFYAPNSYNSFATVSTDDNKNPWQTLVVFGPLASPKAKVTSAWIYNTGTYYTRMNENPSFGVNSGGNHNLYNYYTHNGAGVSSDFWRTGIEGPYPDLIVPSKGEQSLDVYVYCHFRNVNLASVLAHDSGPAASAFSGIPGNPGIYGSTAEDAIAKKNFKFGVFQAPVSVIKNGATGTVVSPTDMTTAFNNPSVGSTIIIDRTSSRAEGLTWPSTNCAFDFWKKDGNGVYQNITPGVAGSGADLEYGAGEDLYSSIINLLFNAVGEYKITNVVHAVPAVPSWGGTWSVDPADTQASITADERTIQCGAAIPLVITTTWPAIVTQVTEAPSDIDPFDPGPPITSVTPFTIRITNSVDGTGIWSVYNPNTTVTTIVPMAPADWMIEMSTRYVIKTFIRNTVTGITVSRLGWGPHDVTLTAGNYTVQCIAIPNSSYDYQQQIEEAGQDLL